MVEFVKAFPEFTVAVLTVFGGWLVYVTRLYLLIGKIRTGVDNLVRWSTRIETRIDAHDEVIAKHGERIAVVETKQKNDEAKEQKV